MFVLTDIVDSDVDLHLRLELQGLPQILLQTFSAEFL